MPQRRPPLSKHPLALSGRKFIQVVCAGLVIYIMIAGFGGLNQSVLAFRSARLDLVAVAIGLVALSFVAAGITYCLLAARPLSVAGTVLVQVAGGLINRLLPAGLGGLGLNALYLKRQGHSAALAAAIVGLNNMLGFVGNMLLLGIVVAFSSLRLTHINVPAVPWQAIAGLGILFIGGTVFVMIRFPIRSRTHNIFSQIGQYISSTARRPLRSFGALASSCAVTALHATALYVVMLALHLPAAWPTALVAISAGAFTGAAVPSPGGLGGAEAGIAAALAAYSVPSGAAVTAALMYRGLTYWLPLLPGYIAFRIVEKRYV